MVSRKGSLEPHWRSLRDVEVPTPDGGPGGTVRHLVPSPWIRVVIRPCGRRTNGPGADPRETQAQGGFNDGDVLQCRVDLGVPATPATIPGISLARSDAPVTGDNCGNAGGLDQNIYGTSVTFD